MKTTIFALSVVACWECMAALGWTVNLTDEMDALANLEPEARTNVWDATYGGKWSVYTRTNVDRPYAEYTNGSRRLVGFYANDYKYFTLLANTNSVSVTGPHGGNQVPADEIYFHPYGQTSTEIIRYTVAEHGYFAVTGRVQRLSASGNGIVARVFLDGVEVACATSSLDQVTGCFSTPPLSCWPKSRLELRLDSNGNISNDATALKYAVTRCADEDVSWPWVSTVWHELEAAAGETEVNNPLTCAEGQWSFYKRTSGVDEAMTAKYVDSTSSAMVGLAFASSGKTYPRIVANTSGSNQNVTDGSPVYPGELFVHPNQSVSVVVRFMAVRGGYYSISVQARNLNSSGNSILKIERNGVTMESAPVVNCVGGVTATVSRTAFSLSPGHYVDVVLDPNGTHAYDATALKIIMSYLGQNTTEVTMDALEAFCADMKSASPTTAGYVHDDGSVWSFGTYGLASGFVPAGFAAFTERCAGLGAFDGWMGSAVLQGRNYPYLLGNTNGVGGTAVSGHEVQAGEFAFHPYDRTYGVLRFHATQSGVYAMTGLCRALNGGGGDGLDAHVVVNGGTAYPVNGAVSAKDGDPSESFESVGVWLRANDTLDLAVGPGAAGNDYGYDAAAVRLWCIRKGDLPSTSYVGFDLKGATRATYAGAGRVGFGSDGTWAALDLVAGSRRSEPGSYAGEKVATRLRLSKGVSAQAADCSAPITDGALSEGVEDPIVFQVTGLVPNAEYTFHAFSWNSSGEPGRFTVGGETYAAAHSWFSKEGNDCCTFTATADVNGVVEGSFAGTATGAATFCALQVEGEEFPIYIPRGMSVNFR